MKNILPLLFFIAGVIFFTIVCTTKLDRAEKATKEWKNDYQQQERITNQILIKACQLGYLNNEKAGKILSQVSPFGDVRPIGKVTGCTEARIK